jgi:molecular chaperone DnaK (HSP70)
LACDARRREGQLFHQNQTMSRSNQFIKRQKEEKRRKKKQEKEQRKEERRQNSPGGSLESMLAYVDENGNITTEPPEKRNNLQTDKENT